MERDVSDSSERPVQEPLALRPLSDSLDDELAWALVDEAPDGIVLADEGGRILLVNRRTEELFGYDRGELLGRPVEQLLPESLRGVHRAHRTRYRADPHARPMGAGLALRGRRADGSEFPVEISLSPLRQRGTLRIVATLRDVTERVEAEARVREVREILDATRDAVSILDAETLRFSYVNQGWVEQLGYSAEDALGMTMLHITPEFTQGSLRALLAPLQDGRERALTFRAVHRRRDGDDVPVEILLQAVVNEGRPPHAYVKIARDISERLESESRQRAAEQQLRLVEDRERLARDLHDVVIQRLFATGMAAQALQARIEDPAVGARAAGIVDELDQTIREIRTVIFALQQPTETRRSGLRGTILDVVDDERVALGFMPHVVFDGVIDETPDEIGRQLLAILREAVSNVARHAGATSVEIEVCAGPGEMTLRVVDDGRGFRPDAVGSGNGLRNMAARAESLGGTCTVSPRPGGGTIVECRLRLVAV